MRARLLMLSAVPLLFFLGGTSRAQPTYKLDVKPEFRPRAALQLADDQVRRSPVSNDPGFRLQFHFRKEGKTVQVVEARRILTAPVAGSDPGLYSAVLEVFYPAYRGGTAQKGEFRPISNILTYRIEPGTPRRVTRVIVPLSLAARAAGGLTVPLLP